MSLLYDYQVWLRAGFMKVTSRSIKYFGFQGENLYGSSVDFQWAEGRHNMLGVRQLVGICQGRFFFFSNLLEYIFQHHPFLN